MNLISNSACFVIIVVHLTFCSCSLQYFVKNPDIATILNVLHDIFGEFYLKSHLHIDIATIKVKSTFLLDILDDLMSKNDGKFVTLIFTEFVLQTLIFRKYFFIIESIYDLYYVEEMYKIGRFSDVPIYIFALIYNLTFDQLKVSPIHLSYSDLSQPYSTIFQYTYFITNEADTVTLSTVEWFSPHGCDQPFLNNLNVFNKKSRKWISKLKNYEKFLEYHNCELVMVLPVPFDNENYHMSGYAILDIKHTSFKVYGITPIIFEIASENYNFTVDYQPCIMTEYWIRNEDITGSVRILKINKTAKQPHVHFEILPLESITADIATSNVVANLDGYMLVTPAEKYTPYEKFLLPFDFMTWILVLTTFLVTFVSILCINHFSKSTQSLVYGHKVDTPFSGVESCLSGT